MSSDFDSSCVLDRKTRIECAGIHLYKIGLSLEPDSRVRRNIYRNPVLCFVFQCCYLIRSIFLLFYPGDLNLYRKMGDFGFIFGTMEHLEFAVISTILLSFESQILNYVTHQKGVRPSYFRLFDMLSGQIPPKDLGLNSERIVEEILRKTRLLYIIGQYIPMTLGASLFLINFLSFLLYSTWQELLIYVVPNSIGWFLIVNVVYSNTTWQLIYFYLIALYLKSKLKEVNNRLKICSKWKLPVNYLMTLKKLTAIYDEIAEYNDKYWCHFILFVWTNSGAILSSITFLLLFGEMLFFIRIFVLNFVIFFVLLILLVINTCATVYLEANKSHKLLISLLCKQSKRNALRKFKVIIFM